MIFDIIPKSEFDRIRESGLHRYNLNGLYADMCRYNTFVSVKKAGSGHLGSSFSAMDIVVYLYLNELNVLKVGTDSPDRDIYFSSKGHDVPGLYSVFFSFGFINEDELMRLRRIDGPDGHPDIKTKGIESNTGSLGMGISKGRGFAWVKNYKNYGGRVFVLTGDGEFQEGQIYESLQATAHQKVNNLTVIIDRNKFQTDRPVDEINNIEDLQKKIESFGWHVQRINGHILTELESAIKISKTITDKPKMIIADTIKGAGISFMENPYKNEQNQTMYKWHSGAPDDDTFTAGIEELKAKLESQCMQFKIKPIEYKEYENYEKSSPLSYREYVTDAYGDELCKIAEYNKDFVVMDADLSADCKLRNFEYTYPDRFIENGIAEQDMVSMAGGMARMGITPIVNSFASFLTSRANEQIYNNACEHTKIIYTTHFAGMIPAGPGKSHQSVRDLSLLGAIPNIEIIQPCNSEETRMATRYAINKATTNIALRLVIGPSPRKIDLPEDYKLEVGKGVNLTDGDDAILFAYGPVMLNEALGAAEILRDYKFNLKVVNMPWLNKIDRNWLIQEIDNYKQIFVLEDHSNYGGLGDRLLDEFSKIGNLNYDRFEKLGLDEYPACGVPQEVLTYHRLDAKSLAERILNQKLENTNANIYSAEAPQ